VEGRESSIGAVSEASFLLLGTNGSNMSDQLTRSGGRRAKRAIRISPRFWRPLSRLPTARPCPSCSVTSSA